MQLQAVFLFLGATMASPLLVTRQSTTPTLPQSSLPEPASSTSLKQITLGLGHQNYTCDSAGTATAIGATAALFDLKPILSKASYLAPYIPGTVLGLSGLSRDSFAPGASSAAADTKDYRTSLPQLGVNPVGYHYFNTDKLPVFTLPAFKASIVGRKQANVAAPATALQGPDGQAAVDWLLLAESGQGKSFGGLSAVYRVHTAGGSGSGVCAGKAAGTVVRVPYATEYWFYGP